MNCVLMNMSIGESKEYCENNYCNIRWCMWMLTKDVWGLFIKTYLILYVFTFRCDICKLWQQNLCVCPPPPPPILDTVTHHWQKNFHEIFYIMFSFQGLGQDFSDNEVKPFVFHTFFSTQIFQCTFIFHWLMDPQVIHCNFLLYLLNHTID